MAFEVASERAGGYAGAAPTPSVTDLLAEAGSLLRRAADLDLGATPTPALADAIDHVVRVRRTVAAVEAKVVAAADRAGLAGEAGAVDTVALLKDRARMSGRDAKRTVDLGRRLERLPGTAAALADGELGVEQAEQVARAVHTGRLGMPGQVEASLLETAKSSTPEQLRDEVKRREVDADGDRLLKDERLAHSRRALNTWTENGMHRGTWQSDLVTGQLFETFIRAFMTFDDKDTSEELKRTPEQRRLDAFAQGAKVALGAGGAPTNAGEKPHVSVVVTAESLAGDPGAHPAEMAWGGPLSRTALQRILCDATLTRIIADADSQVLDVGRATRVWNGSQRRAIVALDGGCRFPGCDRPAAWTDIHHAKFWERDQGRTDLCNGVLLCEVHHHLCHEGGWRLTMDGQTRIVTVVSPNGRTRLTSEPRGIVPRTATTRRRAG